MLSTSRHPLRGALVRIAVRTVVLVGIDVAALGLSSLSTSNDPNIGLGLIIFALIAVVSGAGGILDGRRYSFVAAAWPWLPIAALASFSMILATSFGEGITFGEKLSSAFTSLPLYYELLPFLFCLVILPAIAGVALGSIFRASRDGRTSGASDPS